MAADAATAAAAAAGVAAVVVEVNSEIGWVFDTRLIGVKDHGRRRPGPRSGSHKR